MTSTRYSKDKGSRFQVEIAETIARNFDLTIEALSPRSIGKTRNGVRYISEDSSPDIKIRSGSLNGADIVMMTPRAKAVFPFSIECKIRKQIPSVVHLDEWREMDTWMKQASQNTAPNVMPAVVFRSNRSKPWIAIPFHAPNAEMILWNRTSVVAENWAAFPFPSFLKWLTNQ